ncbi:hypothetical protein [Streptomyces himalayensis]|uniref:hypothetical protein n=1 Tax=Streptomyces himalayensis TaxID=2820085 RepID=UPI001C69C43B|nr:hypothetical protein [Streptomyces himalayensis]
MSSTASKPGLFAVPVAYGPTERGEVGAAVHRTWEPYEDEQYERPPLAPRCRGAETKASAGMDMRRHGLADPALDPAIAAAALAAMTWRFGEQWLVQGRPQCDFDTGVEQITRLVVNALRL